MIGRLHRLEISVRFSLKILLENFLALSPQSQTESVLATYGTAIEKNVYFVKDHKRMRYQNYHQMDFANLPKVILVCN